MWTLAPPTLSPPKKSSRGSLWSKSQQKGTVTRDEEEFPDQCKAHTAIKKISPSNQPINQNLSSPHGVRVAASVNHSLCVFPPSAFLVTFQTDSCVLQTNPCKWPGESRDYSPLLWCAPTRETIRTDHSGLPLRSGLADILIALSKPLLLFFLLKKFASFRASSLHHLFCAAKPVISYMTQYVSILSYSVGVHSLWVWALSGFLSPATCLFYILQSEADDRDFHCWRFGETDRSRDVQKLETVPFLGTFSLDLLFFFFYSFSWATSH